LPGAPAGVDGFDELARSAVTFDVDGFSVLVASLEDLIRMKRAAGRPKDLIAAEWLSACATSSNGSYARTLPSQLR
jgi:hypothetical protein